MEIKINGEIRQVDEGLTIAGLLEKLGITGDNLVIEYNGKFLEDEDFAWQTLTSGDTLEIVRFVGGG